MPAPQIILELIERFERNSEAYKSGNYNETLVRRGTSLVDNAFLSEIEACFDQKYPSCR